MRFLRSGSVWVGIVGALASPARAEDVVLYGAGSLRGAMTEIVSAYTTATGHTVRTAFGPAGVMREKIEAGDHVDLFASANMDHAQKLRDDGRAASVTLFARNSLCAVALPDAKLTAENFAKQILEPAVKLGTSTPKADPAGDYTWEMFRRIDKSQPGAYALLDKKAQKVFGGFAATGSDPITGAFAHGDINTLISYCSGASAQARTLPNAQVVVIPTAIAPTPEYGLAILSPANSAATSLAAAILSPTGQAALEKAGFRRIDKP